MQPSYLSHTIQEAVAIFGTQVDLDAAIAELEVTAFPRHDISVLGNRAEIMEKLGTDSVPPEWLEDDPQAPRSISVRPEEKTIGATVFIGACAYVLGTLSALQFGLSSTQNLMLSLTIGSLIGAFLGSIIVFFVWKKFKFENKKKINTGGLLLWVRTPSREKENIAQKIMRRHGGRNIHIHTIT